MRHTEPPSAATWLLTHLGRRNESLVGDLLEEYRRGRSSNWYWRQVVAAIAVDLGKPVLFALAIFFIYRIAAHIQVPGANGEALAALGRTAGATSLWKYDLVTGGNLSHATIFALGITPYISASIVVQVMALVWWSLTDRRATPWQLPIVRLTWATAIVLCVIQAAGIALFLERLTRIPGTLPLVFSPGWAFRASTILTLTAGSACLMWISDELTGRRIGNGMLLIFIVALLSGVPATLMSRADPIASTAQVAGTLGVVALTSYGYRRAIEARQRPSVSA
jgi:preprotein translocase subunit SecY